MPPLDPAAAAYLAEQQAAGVRPDHELTVDQMRAAADVSTVHEQRDLPVTTEDVLVPGPGGPIPMRIARPEATPAGVIVYAHGGGWARSSGGRSVPASSQPSALAGSGSRQTRPRSATGTPRPPASLDLLADPEAGIVIAGDSAGGNLTAVLARRLRDAGDPPPLAQVLVYPTLDAVAYRQAAYPSHRECATGYGLTYADGLAYWDHYLRPDGDPAAADTSPLRVADLTGLPPAYVLTAEYDVLRDEGWARSLGGRIGHVASQPSALAGSGSRQTRPRSATCPLRPPPSLDYLRGRWAGGEGGGQPGGEG